MNKFVRAAACVGTTAAFFAVLPVSTGAAVTVTPDASNGTLLMCADELLTPHTIITIDFEGPSVGQASLLHRDCESFSVREGRYDFVSSVTPGNACAPNTTLAVVFRRGGVNYYPNNTTDNHAYVAAGQETRAFYFCR